MYPVSDKFIQAIQSNSRSYFWTGEITTKKGQKYTFENKDIVKGSGYITRQCCGNTEIELGTVYAAEMGISLFMDINRYSLEDGTITLSFHLDVGGEYEEVPMGIFEISEANRSIKTLEIKAYDYMLNFEKNFRNKLSSGTPYDFYPLPVRTVMYLSHTQEPILKKCRMASFFMAFTVKTILKVGVT